MKHYVGVIIFIFTSVTVSEAQKIKWLSWEEAIEASAKEEKKIFVDIYTQWCGWCKKMDATTFSDPNIVKYINENYYAIKFDAELKEDIQLNGKVYKYIKMGKSGYHELVAELTRGQLSYPTIVFLDEKMNLIQPIPGFRDPKSFEMIMHYFAEDYHISTPWKKYSKNYNMLIGNKN